MPRTDLELIYERLSGVTERDDVEEFAIGTTADLARCRAALNADDVISLDEPETPEDAAEVEEALLARFGSHVKCAKDDALEPDTATLDDDSVLSVFVAIWWRA